MSILAPGRVFGTFPTYRVFWAMAGPLLSRQGFFLEPWRGRGGVSGGGMAQEMMMKECEYADAEQERAGPAGAHVQLEAYHQ